MNTANLPAKHQASYPLEKAAKSPRVRRKKEMVPPHLEIDPADPAVSSLSEQIQVIGAYVSQEVKKRADACGVEATVYFRVKLTKPKSTPGDHHGS